MSVSQDDWIMPEAPELPIEDEPARSSRFLLSQYTSLAKDGSASSHYNPITLSKIQQFGAARLRYNEQLSDFFSNGSLEQIEEFFNKITKQRYFQKVTSSVLKKIKTFPKALESNIEIFKQGLLLLNQDNKEAALLYFYLLKGKIVESEDGASVKKLLSYEFNRNITELKTIEWLVQKLKLLCTDSFVNAFLQKNTAKNQAEDYHLEDNAKKLLTEMQKTKQTSDVAINVLIASKTSPFSFQYRSEVLVRNSKLSESYSLTLNELIKLSQIQAKGKTVFNSAAEAMQSLSTRCQLMAKMYYITHELNHLEQEIRQDYEKIMALKKQVLKLETDIEKIAKDYWGMAIDLMTKLRKEKAVGFGSTDEAGLNQKIAEFQNEYRTLIDQKLKPLLDQFSRTNSSEIMSEMKGVAAYLRQVADNNAEFIKYMNGLLQIFIDKRREQISLKEKTKEQEAIENAEKIAEYRRVSEEKLLKRKADLEKEKAQREKLKLEERQKILLAKQKLKPPVTPELADTTVLFNEKMLNVDPILLDLIFTKPTPHNKISYSKIVNLVETMGGSVTAPGKGGSHRGYEIEQGVVEIGSVIGLVDVEEEDETLEDEVEVGKQSGGLVKPHSKGHNAKKLPGIAIQQFRDTLELAGVTPTNLARIKKAVIKPLDSRPKP